MNISKDYQASALVIGANRGIGLGFVKKLLEEGNYQLIIATYRSEEKSQELFKLKNSTNSNELKLVQLDVTEENEYINFKEILSKFSKNYNLKLVICCVGVLHSEILELSPEKSISQVDSLQLLHYFNINSIGPILVLKNILPFIKHGEPCKIALISAKVGSIGDNYLGGWFGYRASKAALNMLVKTASIEYKRKVPEVILTLLHPGTTDTDLSKPFQKNVKPEKLFSVEKCVSQLLNVINNTNKSDSGKFFSWDSSELPW